MNDLILVKLRGVGEEVEDEQEGLGSHILEGGLVKLINMHQIWICIPIAL